MSSIVNRACDKRILSYLFSAVHCSSTTENSGMISLGELLVSDSTIKDIFDHLRNMFIGSTVLAFAVLVTKSGVDSGSVYQLVVGTMSIFGAFGLLAYNSMHGMKKLQERLSKPKAICISIIYYPIFLEIIRVAWSANVGS